MTDVTSVVHQHEGRGTDFEVWGMPQGLKHWHGGSVYERMKIWKNASGCFVTW
jgi:hypothetical protein